MLFAGFTAVKKTIIQNWFTPHMCREAYWIRSLLQIVSCECTTARVGGARPSTIEAWQCFLLNIRDYIKEWLLCSCCPSLSPSLLIEPWDVEYVSAVLFCFILDIMLYCVWKKLNKKLLITKKKKKKFLVCLRTLGWIKLILILIKCLLDVSLRQTLKEHKLQRGRTTALKTAVTAVTLKPKVYFGHLHFVTVLVTIFVIRSVHGCLCTLSACSPIFVTVWTVRREVNVETEWVYSVALCIYQTHPSALIRIRVYGMWKVKYTHTVRNRCRFSSTLL